MEVLNVYNITFLRFLTQEFPHGSREAWRPTVLHPVGVCREGWISARHRFLQFFYEGGESLSGATSLVSNARHFHLMG